MKLPGETHVAYLCRLFGIIEEQTKQYFGGVWDAWYERQALEGLEDLAEREDLLPPAEDYEEEAQ